MKQFTHVFCLTDVIEDDVILFKRNKFYKLLGYDRSSLCYYIEPEQYPDDPNIIMPDEYAIYPFLNKNFKFLPE